MKKTRRLNILSSIAINLIVLLSLFSNIDSIAADGIGPIQRFNTNFDLEEYLKYNENKQNVNSINITLPSSSWFIQDVELNFTEIKFGKEVKTIESQNYMGFYDRIYHQTPGDWNRGLGIQIKLNEPTTIFGVDLYGVKKYKSTPRLYMFKLRAMTR